MLAVTLEPTTLVGSGDMSVSLATYNAGGVLVLVLCVALLILAVARGMSVHITTPHAPVPVFAR